MAPWPHYPSKMSLASDCRNLCTPAMEASSIVQVQQLQILYRRRCPHHNLQCMFSTLWTERIVVAREYRQKDGGRWWMVKCQTATDEWASQPWSRRSGVPVASVADEAPALCVWTSCTSNQTGGGVLNRLQPVHQSFRDTYRRTELQ